MALINLNVQNVEPQSFDVLPAGWYPAQITASEMCQTKAGNGQYLKLEFTVIGDKFAGRKVWTNLNIDNPNPKAVEIAYQNLASICDAINHNGNVKDSQELHGKPMQIKLVERNEPTFGPSNEIKGYSKLDGSGTPSNFGGESVAPPVAASPNRFVPPGMK